MAPTREQLHDLAWRALWTALQTGISVIVVGGIIDLNVETWKVAVLSAGAAALSAVKSFSAQQLQRRQTA